MFSFLTSAEEDKKRFELRNPDGIWENGNQICFSCERQFTFVKRRHHCRSCGKEVCATCSALKMEGTRACIFCFVTSKKDVMAMVKNASKTTSPSSANNSSSNINRDYETDVSNLSGRETLESFVINQSIVSMSDINDDNNQADANDINEMFLQTPSKDKESNNSKVDEKANTFIAPWSVSPSSAGGNSPQAVTANNSPNVHVHHVNSDHASHGTPIVTNSCTDQNNDNNNDINGNNKSNNKSNNNSNSSESPAVSVHEKDAASSSSRESFVEEEKSQKL